MWDIASVDSLALTRSGTWLASTSKTPQPRGHKQLPPPPPYLPPSLAGSLSIVGCHFKVPPNSTPPPRQCHAPMHHPCTDPMHGPACPSSQTQIRPHLTSRHQDYMILLLNYSVENLFYIWMLWSIHWAPWLCEGMTVYFLFINIELGLNAI